MPTRSLNTFVLKWPEYETVINALKMWASNTIEKQADVIRIGYFGSYARGDWGVGSDLDLVIIISHSDEPFEKRAAKWEVTNLPVPADLLIYTEAEWNSLNQQSKFTQMLLAETIWL